MYDLNVPWPVQNYTSVPTPAQITNLHNTIAALYALGIRYVAVNFQINENIKLPLTSPDKLNPIPLADLKKRFAQYDGLHLFSRITLVITDPAKVQSIQKLNNSACFDLIAVQPTTEKALQLTTTNLDIDIVSLPMCSRLPFFLKHKTVGQAIVKGIKFEMCYSGLIAGPAGYETSGVLGTTGHLTRKVYFSNALQLIRASRSRGLLFSSGASEPLHARNYADILALMDTLGLKTSNAKDGFVKNPELALVSGRLRIRANKQTVMAGNTIGSGSRASTIVEGEVKKVLDYKRKLESVGVEPKRRHV